MDWINYLLFHCTQKIFFILSYLSSYSKGQGQEIFYVWVCRPSNLEQQIK